MKKKIILLGILAISCFSVRSQTLTVGPKVGVNVTTLTNLEGLESRAGFTAGGFLVYSFIENFGVGVDLLYSKEGARYEFDVRDGDDFARYKFKTDLNYFRINVPFNYFFFKQENAFRPKIFAGPSLGILLSAKNKSELISATGNSMTVQEGTTTVTGNYKTADFGALIGTGFNCRLAESTWLNFDVAYHIGASDIASHPENNADPIHNSGFAFTLGVGFGF